jgi:hypothetical protein
VQLSGSSPWKGYIAVIEPHPMSTTRLCQHAGPISFHNLLSSTEKINEKKDERDREKQVPSDTTEFSLA